MLRVAFLGCGRVATHIAQFFEKGMPGTNVLIVCDVVKEKADILAKRLGAIAVYDINEILTNPDIDVVLVLTESGKHGVHARMILEVGKHVIVEKPIGLHINEVVENEALAAKKHLLYAAVKQNRYNPAITQLKETYDSGRFGKLVLASIRLIWCRTQSYYEDGWHGTWEMDGGVISQQAIHHIDALRWICGPITEVVSAQLNALNKLEAEDTTVALVRFQNSALGTIEVTTAARPDDKEASICLVGEKGTAEVAGIALNKITSWNFINKETSDETVVEEFSRDVPNGYGLSHEFLLQDIFDRLNKGNIQPPISATDALASVRLVHALYKSTEEHRWVNVDDEAVSKRLGHKSE